MYSSTGWLSNASANKIKHSYVEGFLDVSGSLTHLRGDVETTVGKTVIRGNVDLSVGNKVGIGTITNNPSGQLEIYEPIGSGRTSTTGTVVIRHGNETGRSSILFPSKNNYGSDYAYIQYEDDRANDLSYERSTLIIATGNDSDDNIELSTPGTIVINNYSGNRGKVHVDGYYNLNLYSGYWGPLDNYGGNPGQRTRPLGLFCHGHIICLYFHSFSDRRIKHNISEVPDDLSLQIIRDLPVKYYNYIDVVEKGPDRVIGFIAQEVQELLPEAVNVFKNCIPDEYRQLEDVTWEETSDNKFKLICDLQDCSGVTYVFKVCDRIDSEIFELRITGNEDNSFTFEKKYSYIFLYGKVVDDFMALDESQIYAVGISALQEVDREQQADKARIATLETENNTLKTQMADLLARITALESA